MTDSIAVEQELAFLAAQAGTGNIPAIQKLSPAQMAALAAGLGRKKGVKIDFGDFSTAATDGKTISLPLTGRENSWIIRGYLDHELSHLRKTDFDLIPNQSAFHKSLWNVIEDIRIEAQMPILYPGMASNYRALIRELRNTTPGFFEISQGAPPEAVIATYISLMLRAMYLKQVEVADLAINARQVFIDTFGAQLERDLFTEIMTISDVSTPQDVIDMVERIIELSGRHAAEQTQGDGDAPGDVPDATPGDAPGNAPGDAQNQKPDGEKDDAPGNAQGQGQDDTQDGAGSQAQDKNQNDATGDNGDNQQEPSDNAQQQPPNNSDLGTPGDNPQPGSPDNDQTANNASARASPQNRIQQALESDQEIGDFGKQLRDLAQEKERPWKYQSFDIAVPADKADMAATGYTQQLITAHSGLVARLSSRLRGLLQAQDLQSATPGTTGNRIARNRLHRIRTGDPKLFLRKSPQKMVNTAIHLLIDNSASMDDNQRFHVTKEVTLALVKSLEHMRGVNLAVTVFPAYYPYNRSIGSTSIPVAPLLSHGNKPGRKMFYPGAPKGQTPLHAAVRFAASEMLSLPEPRKILLVLTDGEPDCTDDAEAAIQETVGLGIEVVALGIEQLAFPDIFQHFQVVRTVEELPEKTFSLLERLLTRN